MLLEQKSRTNEPKTDPRAIFISRLSTYTGCSKTTLLENPPQKPCVNAFVRPIHRGFSIENTFNTSRFFNKGSRQRIAQVVGDRFKLNYGRILGTGERSFQRERGRGIKRKKEMKRYLLQFQRVSRQDIG